MFGFKARKTKNEKKAAVGDDTPYERAKKGVETVVKEDLLGSEDWNRSKIGYITGFSAGARAVGSIGKTVGESYGRLGSLMTSLSGSENVPGLDAGGTSEERFAASMVLHGKRDRDLPIILLNTKRAFYLYLSISLVGLGLSLLTIINFPPNGIFDTLIRLGPLPLVFAMLLKHGYTNWIVCRRRFDGLLKYILGGDWFPKN